MAATKRSTKIDEWNCIIFYQPIKLIEQRKEELELRKKKIEEAKGRLDAVKTLISKEIKAPNAELKTIQANPYVKVEKISKNSKQKPYVRKEYPRIRKSRSRSRSRSKEKK